MKKIVLIALVLVVMVGCSETEVDTPSFADGQATALTIDRIRDDIRHVVSVGPSTVKGGFTLEEHLNTNCAILNNFLFRPDLTREYYPDTSPSFNEEYQGLGVWTVELTHPFSEDEAYFFKWKVYESTATVETISTYELHDGSSSAKYIC